MRVLVTGATGSVGSAVTERFTRDGYRVRALVRAGTAPAGAEPIEGDITDRAVLREAVRGVDLAVHCAAAVSDLETCLRVNVDGTRCLIEALAAAGRRARLVHISTVSVYDDAAGPDYDEESALWTTTEGAYGFSKAEAERLLHTGTGRDVASIVLRPPLILSTHPRSRWGPLAIARARTEEGCLLPFPELPYVHVDNLVDAIVLAAHAPVADGRAYNVVEGIADTREYLEVIYGAAGRAAPPIPDDAPRLRFAADRIRRELGWAPRDRWRELIDELRRSAD
ncbi:MAG TPA: NAD(P)-dependent oxidoreductase [Polyangia bacterium]